MSVVHLRRTDESRERGNPVLCSGETARDLPALLLLVLLALPARADSVTSTWHLDESPGSTTVTSDDGFVGTFEDDGHGTGPVLVSPSTYDASAGMLTFDGHGRVIVLDEPALDPFTEPFSVTVHVRTPRSSPTRRSGTST